MAEDTSDDTLTLPEVAKRLGVSPRTLQRREDELRSVGATRTGAGWRIPASAVESLSSVALKRRNKASNTRQTTNERSKSSSDGLFSETTRPTTLLIELAELRAVSAQQRERIEFLERQVVQLVETTKEATSANAALSLSLRQSLTSVEHGTTSERQPEAAREQGPEVTPGGIRGRLRRFVVGR